MQESTNSNHIACLIDVSNTLKTIQNLSLHLQSVVMKSEHNEARIISAIKEIRYLSEDGLSDISATGLSWQ